MERRSALKTLATAVGGLVSLPAWAAGWSAESLGLPPDHLSADQRDTLAALVDTLIPATDTPGARELQVPQFIQKVVADCYDKKTQDLLASGLLLTDELARKAYGNSFAGGDTSQRIQLLKGLEQSPDAAQKDFVGLVKGLTIRGYLNSEYVMTNLTHYEMIPSRYHGCVPVKQS